MFQILWIQLPRGCVWDYKNSFDLIDIKYQGPSCLAVQMGGYSLYEGR